MTMDIMSIKPEVASNTLMFRHDTQVAIQKIQIADASGRTDSIPAILFYELSRDNTDLPVTSDYFTREEDREIRAQSPQFPAEKIIRALNTIRSNEALLNRLGQQVRKISPMRLMLTGKGGNHNCTFEIEEAETLLKSLTRFSYVAFSFDLTHLIIVTYTMRPEHIYHIPESEASRETLREFAKALCSADPDRDVTYVKSVGQLDIPYQCLMETIIRTRSQHPGFIPLTEYFIKGSRLVLSDLMFPTQGHERIQPFFATLLITPDDTSGITKEKDLP